MKNKVNPCGRGVASGDSTLGETAGSSGKCAKQTQFLAPWGRDRVGMMVINGSMLGLGDCRVASLVVTTGRGPEAEMGEKWFTCKELWARMSGGNRSVRPEPTVNRVDWELV
jgi:transglutaminase-like putative cysteine protease